MSSTRTLLAAGSALIAALGASATHGLERPSELLQLRLQPTSYNAGRTGTAVLSRSGEATGLTLTLSGVPDGTTRPIHLYSFLFEGSCASRGASTALTRHALAESVVNPASLGAFRGPVRMSYRIARPFESLRDSPIAVAVRLSPADGGREIFCGDNRAPL